MVSPDVWPALRDLANEVEPPPSIYAVRWRNLRQCRCSKVSGGARQQRGQMKRPGKRIYGWRNPLEIRCNRFVAQRLHALELLNRSFTAPARIHREQIIR